MKASLLGAAVAAVAPLDLLGGTKGRPKKGGAELKISLQEGVTPGETLKEKLDFMENHGVVGLEPNGAGLAGRVGELKEALRGCELNAGTMITPVEPSSPAAAIISRIVRSNSSRTA